MKFIIFFILIVSVGGHRNYNDKSKLKYDERDIDSSSNSDESFINYNQKPSKGGDAIVDDAFDVYPETKYSSYGDGKYGYQNYNSKSSSSSSSSSESSESYEHYTTTTKQQTTATTPSTTTTSSCTGCPNPFVKPPPEGEAERWNVEAILTPSVVDGCDVVNVKCNFTDQPEPQALKTGYMIFNGADNINVNPSADQGIIASSLTCSAGILRYNGGIAVNSVSCESSVCNTCEIITSTISYDIPTITYDDLDEVGCRRGTITCDYSDNDPTNGVINFGLIGLDGTEIDYVGTSPGPPQTVVQVQFTCDSTGYGVYSSPTGQKIEFQFAGCTDDA